MTRCWIAVLSLILFAPSGAAASVLYANPTDPACNGGSPCFGTIQAAIDVAGAGDVVRLQAGTYVERVLVSGKNAVSSASESDRIRIEADPDAAVGSVVLDGAVDVCTNGSAIRFQQSKFVTVEGLTITAAGGQAIELMGGNNGNQAIHVERNRIFGNGSTSCNGGITMARGNPDTLIANNLIYGNGRNGVATIDADGGPHILVGNTIYANGWNGIRVTRSHLALLANNLIFGNGTSSGSTGGRFGVQREDSTTPDPAGIRLLHDVICANRLGEIDGPVLDASDAANLTPTGAEGAGVVASVGCAVAAQVFESLGDPASAQIDFGLAEGSPAVDVGLDPRALGLGAAFDTSFEADFSGSAERPLDGDDDGSAAFDAGALEMGGGGPPPGPTPTIAIANPTDGAVVTQSPLDVSGGATDADAVTVNGVPATLSGGSFTASIPLVEGANSVSATASSGFGAATRTITVVLDTPPAVAIASPAEGERLTDASVLVEGTVSDATGLAGVVVNGVAADVTGNTFSASVPLEIGENVLTATATDSFGSTVSASVTVLRGELPTVVVGFPADGAIVAASPLEVTGSFTGTAPVSVLVDGISASVSGTTFSASVPLVAGANPITVTASNDFGAVTTAVTVVLDSAPPSVSIDAPANGTVVNVPLVAIAGSVSDASPIASVTVNGLPAVLDGASFNAAVTLTPGANAVVATATDAAGNTGSDSITVSFVPPPLAISILSPADGITTTESTVVVSGNLTRSGAEVSVNGVAASVTGTSFHASVALGPLSNAITALATLAGEAASDSITVIRVETPLPPPPPDPVATAPPYDPAVATSVFAGTEFLYTGADPIQTDVIPGTIEITRSAVIRGSVSQRGGAPLPSVRVAVKDHPEFGQTLTRADGMFDLALNGGGHYTLEYARAGFLPAQRQVEALWQEYRFADDVVMIPYDGAASSVNPAGATAFVVAQGSLVADADGSRRVTLLFPPGTTGLLRMPNGSSQPLVQPFTVRATEYTVGPEGEQTMPAMLPATSGYTYAFDLSVDQAVSAGAKRVEFSQQVPVYNENFLGFPVGTPVPVGSYDFAKAAWVPEPSGVVVGIVSITSGRADVDIDGNGLADTGTALASLGITDGERSALAALYPAGATLWRGRSSHFTPYDRNFPLVTITAPADAIQPDVPAPNQRQKGDDCCKASGNSVLAIENQGLGESVPVVGTPYQLHYTSERVPGRKLGNTALVIPLSDESLPSSVTEIQLEVQVAGRRFREDFPAQPDLTATFDAWDGRDAYGRPVVGVQTAIVRIGYRYDGAYQGASRFFATNLGGGTPGAVIARGGIVLARTQRVPIGGWDARAQGLGGWTLGVHHAYDPVGKILYRGDGSKRSAEQVPRIVRHVAGGSQPVAGGGSNTGEGGPATAAKLADVGDLALGKDGSIWVVTPSANNGGPNTAIRRIGPDGVIDTPIGGNAGCPFGVNPTGEGGPADAACLPSPFYLEIGPDGSVYIGHWGGSQFVQRVTPDGIIRRFAGTGSRDPYQDGVNRLAANIFQLSGLAAAPDGAVYVGDNYHRYLRVVTPDDLMFAVAGNGLSGNTGDGGAALAASLQVVDLVVAPDGSLVIAVNNRIRRVRPNGLIETIAGGGNPADGLGDGGPAKLARFSVVKRIALAPDGGLYIAQGSDTISGGNGPRVRYVSNDGIISTIVGTGAIGSPVFGSPVEDNPIGDVRGMAVAPDGTLYLSTRALVAPFNNEALVIAVTSPFPTAGIQDLLIASEDGREVYVFNGSGRHLRTLHALTGATLLTFHYDSAGRLAEVVDASSNATAIERGTSGIPTAIVAPFGQTTVLSLNGDGFLSRIANPAGESVNLTYHAGGLLQRFERPSGDASTFAYDGLGRLIADANAAGGLLTLAPSEDTTSTTVEMASALGVVQTFRVEDLADGSGRERIATQWVGSPGIPLSSSYFRGQDGAHNTVFPDGTAIDLATTRDPTPSLGSQAPYVSASTVSTPGGVIGSATRLRAVTTVAGVLATRTDTINVNGLVGTELFTVATGEFLATTPEGRLLARTIDSVGRTTRFEVNGLLPVDFGYDAAGRLANLVQGSGAAQRVTSFAYDADGNLASATDPLLRSVSFGYDGAGRITTQTLPDLRQLGFSYDVNGNLTTLTPPGQPAHIFRYTPIDQEGEYQPPPVAGLSDPRTFFDYDLDKRLVLVTRPDGTTLDFQYDSAGRLAALVRPAGATVFSYTDGTPLAPGSGNLLSIAAPGGETLVFGYDGSLLTSTSWSGPVAGSVSQTYDAFFRPATQRVNGAFAAGFAYDRDGLLVQAGAEVLARDAVTGLLTGTSLGAVSTGIGYSGFGERSADTAALGGSPFYTNTYLRDKLGRLTQKTETIQGTTTVFGYSYDPAGRLEQVAADGVVTASYAYDANGNRLSATTAGGSTSGSYDAQDRLLAYGTRSYAYTGNGDLASKTDTATSQTTSYGYDTLGNLVSVLLPDGRFLAYVIDGQNRRVGKRVNGALVQGWLYQDALEPVAELDGAGSVVARFVYGSSAHVPDYLLKGGATYRIVSDHLGSVRLVVNASNGAVAQRIDYDAFGVVTLDTNPGFQPFGFAGGLYDADTGLVRFGARDYDPEVGRWTAKDPIRFKGEDTNLYGYVLADPVNYIDPFGFDWFRPAGHPYVAGREGTIVEPGPLGSGAVIDDYVPGGHTFADMHDEFVRKATEAGVPDAIANIPSMLPAYVAAVALESSNSLLGLFGVDPVGDSHSSDHCGLDSSVEGGSDGSTASPESTR